MSFYAQKFTQKWCFLSLTKVSHVGTLDLYQKTPDKMQKNSGQSDYSILRKPPKCGENWPFWDIFDVFSRLVGFMDLNPLAPCQASSGTSLEYPHGILWWDLKIAIFCPMVSRAKNDDFQVLSKYPHVATLNLCQKMPNKMQKDSGQSDHSILRKRPKCSKTILEHLHFLPWRP